MSYSCPLNFEQVDASASRLASLIVALLVMVYLITLNIFILYILILDFSVKLFINKKYSLVGFISLKIRKLLNMEEKFTDGGAKRLAGIFGLFFVTMLLLTHFFTPIYVTYIVAAVFLSCSLLDVFINYCLGCQIYYIIKKLYPSFMS